MVTGIVITSIVSAWSIFYHRMGGSRYCFSDPQEFFWHRQLIQGYNPAVSLLSMEYVTTDGASRVIIMKRSEDRAKNSLFRNKIVFSLNTGNELWFPLFQTVQG